MERGAWSVELKGYGFIQRESSNDVFVYSKGSNDFSRLKRTTKSLLPIRLSYSIQKSCVRCDSFPQRSRTSMLTSCLPDDKASRTS